MPLYPAANRAETKIFYDFPPTETMLVVDSTAGFPVPPFLISVNNEIMKVTSMDTAFFNVTRAMEGTTAGTHKKGDKVALRLTAGMWNDLLNEVKTKASGLDLNLHNADTSAHGLRGDVIAIGRNSAAARAGVAIGIGAVTTDSSVSIGTIANTDANSIAIGYFADAKKNGIAIGLGSNALGEWSVALGQHARALNNRQGLLGDATSDLSPNMWTVSGSLSVTGTKNFEIPHPHPDKKYTHMLRHAAVEAPTAGENLYRFTAKATTDGETVIIPLPDYFPYLNKNVDVYASPFKHFGGAYGEVIGDKLHVTCEKAGAYKILVIGTRQDENVQNWDILGTVREVGQSWEGETFIFEVPEIQEYVGIEEVKNEEMEV